jgi:hypothetical protein
LPIEREQSESLFRDVAKSVCLWPISDVAEAPVEVCSVGHNGQDQLRVGCSHAVTAVPPVFEHRVFSEERFVKYAINGPL